MEKFALTDDTRFIFQDGNVFLLDLFGFPNERALSRKSADLFSIWIENHLTTDKQIKLLRHEFSETTAFLEWQDDQGTFRITSEWQLLTDEQIIIRKDVLINESQKDLILRRILARFYFTIKKFNLCIQKSQWCNENQTYFLDPPISGLLLTNQFGRTNQGYAPFFQIVDNEIEKSLSFHLAPCGNWIIKILPQTDGPTQHLLIEMGHSDDRMAMLVKKGQKFFCPPIIVQKVERTSSHLHQFINSYFKPRPVRQYAPIVYNTWFDRFSDLDLERARKQLIAAKSIGAEVFVVDAGWYGSAHDGSLRWYEQVGNWCESTDTAFRGKMALFAQEVQECGLQFGLWLEPERFGPTVPIVKQHPDWFIPSGRFYYPDFTQKVVYDHVFSEIAKLIKTYNIFWLKWDFNFELNDDPFRSELYHYYENFYKLLADLRSHFPHVWLEGCASGGGRLDIRQLALFDSYFLSDNVNALQALRIHQQSLLRAPTGKLGRWVVVRELPTSIPSHDPSQSVSTYVTPAKTGATWEHFENVDLDFALRSAMIGALGFSGDLCSLSASSRENIINHIAAYKKWRKLIYLANTYTLTRTDNTSWIVFFLTHKNEEGGLLFAYRLSDSSASIHIFIPNLEPSAIYCLKDFDNADKYSQTYSGYELMTKGVWVFNDKIYSCSIVEVLKK